MTGTVYPNAGPIRPHDPGQNPDIFFSAIPRSVWTLVEARQLIGRDVTLLGVLLDYKNRSATTVRPSQRTLSRRLNCSPDTIQRSLARLVSAGLIVKQYLRDARGRLRGRIYDLAGVLARMPANAARLRPGAEGPRPGHSRPTPSGAGSGGPRPKPHACGPEAEKENVVEADTDPPALAVVRGLIGVGVLPRVAHARVQEFGADACRRQLEALPLRGRTRDKAATVVAAIQEGWTLPAARVAPSPAPSVPARPAAPRAAAPCPSSPAADPLDGLPPDELCRLEARARAQLHDELPVLRPLLSRGRCAHAVRARMRHLRAPTPRPLT